MSVWLVPLGLSLVWSECQMWAGVIFFCIFKCELSLSDRKCPFTFSIVPWRKLNPWLVKNHSLCATKFITCTLGDFRSATNDYFHERLIIWSWPITVFQSLSRQMHIFLCCLNNSPKPQTIQITVKQRQVASAKSHAWGAATRTCLAFLLDKVLEQLTDC